MALKRSSIQQRELCVRSSVVVSERQSEDHTLNSSHEPSWRRWGLSEGIPAKEFLKKRPLPIATMPGIADRPGVQCQEIEDIQPVISSDRNE